MLVPAVYTLGSFFQFFFYAQVVSETFAMAMVLAAVNWARTGDRRHLWLAAACGVGVFLSWPVWLGPAVAAVFVALLARPSSVRAWASAAAVVVVPIAAFGILHSFMHARRRVDPRQFGRGDQAVAGERRRRVRGAGAGGCSASRSRARRRGRSPPCWPSRFCRRWRSRPSTGAPVPRVTTCRSRWPISPSCRARCSARWRLATAAATIASRLPRASRAAAVLPLLIAVLLVRGRIPLKRQHGPITEPSLAAGRWARGAVPPGCVDYFSRHWLTGYWLHLDVLGNPRLSDRMRAETFDFPDVVGKWVEGKGLPYAIVEDFAAVPRDARVDMVILRSFPPAAVVRNTRPAPAPGSDPESTLCRGK